MTTTPKGFRLHIGVFGRRNAGKSTLVNLASGQAVSIVYDTPGTTTDPLEKAMEFPPLGPVVWIDTAGLDDDGTLGRQRAGRARDVALRVDVAVVVFAGCWGDDEARLVDDFLGRGVPVVAVKNKLDATPRPDPWPDVPEAVVRVDMSAATGQGFDEFRQAVIRAAPADFVESPVIVRDLVPEGGTVILVVPIDKEAPRGRLILPQVQTIRDLLDGFCRALVCRETDVGAALDSLKRPPDLVVTDSQAFHEVSRSVPEAIPLTGFSILFARTKGDLATFSRGAAAIDRLRDGDRVLVAESCTHHREDDDIGRAKLPALLGKKTGRRLEFDFVSGHDFPDTLQDYALVLHCGACMTSRRAVLSRLAACAAAGVPVVNYGMAIAACLGLLNRALGPFPGAARAYHESSGTTE
ncbi:MAG: [FeFe] hydrogenase H-cluster maturation GTPase HydF [Planctomycetes bacterium]|nr:[FeFe] hydrogenase H-cluster maturation GTPase HydF [Planctomycetota bacterium]